MKITIKIRLFFLDLIFPIECLGCGGEGDWLCAECFKEVKFKPKQYCLHCKKENDFGQFCPPCQIIYSLNGVWIAALYEDKLISQAIKSLKYHFVSSLAAVLGKLLILFMDNLLNPAPSREVYPHSRVAGYSGRCWINQARVLKPALTGGVDWRDLGRAKNTPLAILNFKANLIIPVPLSRKRLRWRGFNQAEILARLFSARYGLEINARDLVRIRHKTAQAKLDEASRLENIKNCFVWQGGNLNKRNIVLIDDVVTTGATLNECARVLKANGAGEVWGLVAAKG